MSYRRKSDREAAHLKEPAFLEKYFQKKAIWLTAAAILSPVMLWCVVMSVVDILGVYDDPDFTTAIDVFILVGFLVAVPLVIDEYRFYSSELWNKRDS